MKVPTIRPLFQIVLLIAALLANAALTRAAEPKTYPGWEAGSAYNALYNPKEVDKISGEIKGFQEVVPMPGMGPGTALLLDEGQGESILVHLCPAAFADSAETGLKKGVKTKIRGSWAVIDGKDIFLAAKVKQGEHFEFKVRLSKDGTPFWTLSPEQLAQEQEKD